MDVIAPDSRLESRDGRALRKTVRRSAAASWTPAPDRPDPVSVLAAQDADRVPGLVPLRHARMGVSPFTFYRGAAALMAADLASLPVTGLTVQLSGDAHLSNFGVFASPDRSLVFDLNDFDETLRGPWEWDVHRLVTSVVVAGRSRRFSARETTEAALAAVGSYRQAVASFAAMGPLDTFYARLDTAALRATVARRRTKAATGMDSRLAAARKRTSLQAASKLTEEIDGRLRFRADPPVLVPLAGVSTGASAKALADSVRTSYAGYVASLPDAVAFLLGRFELVDVAHKVVGVGSVGLRAFVALLQSPQGEPLVLQSKEAVASVLETYLPASPYARHGQRVVEGQEMMQATSDIFLGWSSAGGEGRDYYWRQLRDMKASADLETIGARELRFYAGMCGWTLARAHARSGPAPAIAGYLGRSDSFDRAALAFAKRYADLNGDDFARHGQAIADGRLAAGDLS